MYCAQCGSRNDLDAFFCQSCGHDLWNNSNSKIVTVGRNNDNDIVVVSPQASHHHARFVLFQGKILLIDNGSTNGTYVNHHRVNKMVVTRNDVIEIGQGSLFNWDQLNRFLVGDVPTVVQPVQMQSPQFQPQQFNSPQPPAYQQYQPPAPYGNPQPYGQQYQPPYQQQVQMNNRQNQNVVVNVNQSESVAFAVITLLFLIFLYPIGFILNIIGLFTGPKRGCFVAMAIVFIGLPLALILIVMATGSAMLDGILGHHWYR